MKIEINKINSDPCCDYLHVHKLHDTRPMCKISEGDFANLLNDRGLERLEQGEVEFDVPESLLLEKSSKIY